MVLASALLNILSGGLFYYGFTVFFNPIRTALGLSSAVTSVAFAFKRLEEGLLGPVAGFLIDRVAPRKLMLFIFIFSLITADRAWLIIPFLLTYGPGYGGPIPLRSALQADYFGTRSFGTIMGVMSIVTMAGGLASPIVAGWLFDTMGSYRLAWQLFTLTTAPAILLILLAKPPVAKPENNLT